MLEQIYVYAKNVKQLLIKIHVNKKMENYKQLTSKRYERGREGLTLFCCGTIETFLFLWVFEAKKA